MNVKRLFTEHPESVGETYWEHFGSAFSFVRRLSVAAVCCALHAVFPFSMEKSASRIVADLYKQMCVNRSKLGSGKPGR